MKVVITVILSAGLAFCEVQPPYPSRGFRPNPPFNLPVRQPQTVYGVPNTTPAKFSQPSSPQTQYNVPNQQGITPSPNLTPNFSSKQTIPSRSYGTPLTSSPYRTIIDEHQVSNQLRTRPASVLAQTSSSRQTVPSTSYGVPVTSSPYRTIVDEPQVTSSRQNVPSTQYGPPDAKSIEALEQIRQLNLLLQLSQSSKSNQGDIHLLQSQNSNSNIQVPAQQYLPTRVAANFRGNLPVHNSQQSAQQPAQQYLPVKEANNFRDGLDFSQSDVQTPFSISNTNLQQPSQQYLPVREALDFQKDTAQSLSYPEGTNRIIQNKVVISNLNHNADFALMPSQTQRSIEIEQLNVRRLPNPKVAGAKIQVPRRQLASQPQVAQNNKEFDDSRRQVNREQSNEQYLPPSTTHRSIHSSTSRPASFPRDSSVENERPTEEREEAGGPNIAVATSVSGAPGGQSFYLLQPDGRLQRVVYQKTRTGGDNENEYTANYHFQNVQADPRLIYSPLIAVGKK